LIYWAHFVVLLPCISWYWLTCMMSSFSQVWYRGAPTSALPVTSVTGDRCCVVSAFGTASTSLEIL
jgi:hypothetical protein